MREPRSTGFSSSILWLEKSTPGTNRGSTQWSPLQALRLSSKVWVVTLPLTESEEARPVACAKQASSFLAQAWQYSQAIEPLRKAIELQPNSAWAHYELGASLLKKSDCKTATAHLELACARLPKIKQAHLMLAEAYEHLGRKIEAQSKVRRRPRRIQPVRASGVFWPV